METPLSINERQTLNGKAHGPEALEEVWQDTSRLLHYFSTYVGLGLDQKKLSLKEGMIKAAVGLVVLFSLGVVAAASMVFVLLGIAQGIGNLAAQGTPYPIWAGLLGTGSLCLVLILSFAGYQIKKFKQEALKKRMEQYARL